MKIKLKERRAKENKSRERKRRKKWKKKWKKKMFVFRPLGSSPDRQTDKQADRQTNLLILY